MADTENLIREIKDNFDEMHRLWQEAEADLSEMTDLYHKAEMENIRLKAALRLVGGWFSEELVDG